MIVVSVSIHLTVYYLIFLHNTLNKVQNHKQNAKHTEKKMEKVNQLSDVDSSFFSFSYRQCHLPDEDGLSWRNKANHRDWKPPKHLASLRVYYSGWTLLSHNWIHEVWRFAAFSLEMPRGNVCNDAIIRNPLYYMQQVICHVYTALKVLVRDATRMIGLHKGLENNAITCADTWA